MPQDALVWMRSGASCSSSPAWAQKLLQTLAQADTAETPPSMKLIRRKPAQHCPSKQPHATLQLTTKALHRTHQGIWMISIMLSQ
jgi:hypothetical protein